MVTQTNEWYLFGILVFLLIGALWLCCPPSLASAGPDSDATFFLQFSWVVGAWFSVGFCLRGYFFVFCQLLRLVDIWGFTLFVLGLVHLGVCQLLHSSGGFPGPLAELCSLLGRVWFWNLILELGQLTGRVLRVCPTIGGINYGCEPLTKKLWLFETFHWTPTAPARFVALDPAVCWCFIVNCDPKSFDLFIVCCKNRFCTNVVCSSYMSPLPRCERQRRGPQLANVMSFWETIFWDTFRGDLFSSWKTCVWVVACFSRLGTFCYMWRDTFLLVFRGTFPSCHQHVVFLMHASAGGMAASRPIDWV